MEHFGIDLHQKHSDVCGLAESGEIVFQQRTPSRRRRLGCEGSSESGPSAGSSSRAVAWCRG